MELKLPIAGKRIKLFKRTNDDHTLDNMDDDLTNNEIENEDIVDQ